MLKMDGDEGRSMDTLGIDPFGFDENVMDFIAPEFGGDIEKVNKKGNVLIEGQDIEKVNKKGILNL